MLRALARSILSVLACLRPDRSNISAGCRLDSIAVGLTECSGFMVLVGFVPYGPSIAFIGFSRIIERFGKPFDIETSLDVRGWCGGRLEFQRR